MPDYYLAVLLQSSYCPPPPGSQDVRPGQGGLLDDTRKDLTPTIMVPEKSEQLPTALLKLNFIKRLSDCPDSARRDERVAF